jgi:hypothetical protein
LKEKFEILKGLPAYGEMYISIPENGYSEFSEGLAIKFIKNDNTEWIGNFETGSSSLKFATELKNSEDILIIACGICYIMNPEETKPKVEFGHDYKKVFEYKNKFILIGEYSITIIENVDEIKHFDDLCYDGITNIKLENENLIGVFNNYNPSGDGYDKSDFALNLETGKINETEAIKMQNEVKKENKVENTKVLNKKWWKLW